MTDKKLLESGWREIGVSAQGRRRVIAYFSPYVPYCLELMG